MTTETTVDLAPNASEHNAFEINAQCLAEDPEFGRMLLRHRLEVGEIHDRHAEEIVRHLAAWLRSKRAETPADPIDRGAAEIAGYGPDDVPMRPRRSAYTDDAAGTIAFGRACARWVTYSSLT